MQLNAGNTSGSAVGSARRGGAHSGRGKVVSAGGASPSRAATKRRRTPLSSSFAGHCCCTGDGWLSGVTGHVGELNTVEVIMEQQLYNWTRLLPIIASRSATAFLYKSPGAEHYLRYALLAHLSRRLGAAGGGVIVELGAREGASTIALGEEPRNVVFSVDLSDTAANAEATLANHGAPRLLPWLCL
eukprot:gene2500-biopygen8633